MCGWVAGCARLVLGMCGGGSSDPSSSVTRHDEPHSRFNKRQGSVLVEYEMRKI
jgi:hypothetical protein